MKMIRRKQLVEDLKLKNLRKQQANQHIEEANNKSKALWEITNRERTAKSQMNNKITLNIFIVF